MSLEVSFERRLGSFQMAVDFRTNGIPTGLLGASGSGKSMTLRTIAGIEKPDKGRIVLNGRVLFDSEKKINLPPQKRRVGYLFQNYALFPTMTAEANIGIGIRRKDRDKAARIRELVKAYHLEGLENHYPHQLSGGQQQRVALARMMAADPEVILLDEPFSALDAYLREQMLGDLLDMLSGFQGDVILVSHSRDDIYKCCSRLTVISGGHTILSGSTAEIFADPRYTEVCRLTGCKNISRARRINAHTLRAMDWECLLTTTAEVPEDIRAVGIRGHHILPAAGPGVNTIRTVRKRLVEGPFEYQFRMQNADGGQELWWLMDKASGGEYLRKTQQFLYLPPEALMLLK